MSLKIFNCSKDQDNITKSHIWAVCFPSVANIAFGRVKIHPFQCRPFVQLLWVHMSTCHLLLHILRHGQILPRVFGTSDFQALNIYPVFPEKHIPLQSHCQNPPIKFLLDKTSVDNPRINHFLIRTTLTTKFNCLKWQPLLQTTSETSYKIL